jgi:hypothetical protein
MTGKKARKNHPPDLSRSCNLRTATEIFGNKKNNVNTKLTMDVGACVFVTTFNIPARNPNAAPDSVVNNDQYQYSARGARPAKVAYLLKQTLIELENVLGIPSPAAS